MQKEHNSNTEKSQSTKDTTPVQKQPVKAKKKRSDKEKQKNSPYNKNLATMKKNASVEAAEEAAAKKESIPAFVEDNLELKRMSVRERTHIKHERFRQNMEGMSKKEKISYFLYYYKWKIIFGVVFLVLAVAIPVTLYKNSRPVAISYAIINCHYPENLNDNALDDYMNYYGFTKKQQVISSNYSYLNQATYEEDYAANPDSANYTSLPMLCYNGYFDVIIADKTGLEYCAAQSLIQPLESALYPDVYNKISKEYADTILLAENTNGVSCEYGIDISGTSFAQNLNLGYDDVYIGFIGYNERNFSNARKLVNFIFNLGLEI